MELREHDKKPSDYDVRTERKKGNLENRVSLGRRFGNFSRDCDLVETFIGDFLNFKVILTLRLTHFAIRLIAQRRLIKVVETPLKVQFVLAMS